MPSASIQRRIKMNQKYFKAIPKDRTCKGYAYTVGLNEDPQGKPLEEVGSCSPGAFYFCDAENILNFIMGYGGYAMTVEIPKGELIKKDEEGDKWKARRIIAGPTLTPDELVTLLPSDLKVGWNLDLRGCTGLKINSYFPSLSDAIVAIAKIQEVR